MILTTQKADNIGALSSTLCLIHCIATPFIFIVQSCSLTCCSTTPTWWRIIDYLFLIISFFAVYRSTKTSTSTLVKYMLWVSWDLLFVVIVNESVVWFHLNQKFIYFPAIALTVLHLYNKKYCQCKSGKCCSSDIK